MTVDFRLHRLGIGRELLRQGLEQARKYGLNAMTEASESGAKLYGSAGFKTVGVWQIEELSMPVMKWTPEVEGL